MWLARHMPLSPGPALRQRVRSQGRALGSDQRGAALADGTLTCPTVIPASRWLHCGAAPACSCIVLRVSRSLVPTPNSEPWHWSTISQARAALNPLPAIFGNDTVSGRRTALGLLTHQRKGAERHPVEVGARNIYPPSPCGAVS